MVARDDDGPYGPKWHRRQAIWRHNGLLGSTSMAIQAMKDMETMATTTDETRILAQRIEGMLHQLVESLRTRRPEAHPDVS